MSVVNTTGRAELGRRPRRRAAALALPSLLLAVIGLAPALAVPGRAAASTIGVLRVTPLAGIDITPIDLVTSAGCPRPATNMIVQIFGAGFPTSGQNVVGNTAAGFSNDAPFRVPLVDTLRAFSQIQPDFTSFSGAYRLVLNCVDRTGFHLSGDFVGTIAFTSPSAWAATGASRETAPPAAPTATQTALPSTPSAGSPSAAASAAAGGSNATAGVLSPSASARAAQAAAIASGTSHGHRSWTALLAVGAVALASVLFLAGRTYSRRRG
jgi:hypothetical protein